MGGLYDTPNGVLMDPRTAMIMQTGLGLMANSGPSLTPVPLGQAMGRAGTQGLQAFNQASVAQQQAVELQRAEQERKKKEAALAQLKADPRFAGMGALLDVAPSAAITQAFQKPENPFARIDPKDYTPESMRRYMETKNPADLMAVGKQPEESTIARLLRERAALTAGDPRITTYDEAIKRATTHNPVAAVNLPPQEKEFDKEVGRAFGAQYADLMKADMNAPANIGKYQRLGNLLSQAGTGKFTGTTIELKAAAKALGVDLSALGIADNVAPAQAARALANQLALELRNPAGGAGMPGALSDRDREFLLQMIPSLESDPNAWPKMIEYRVKLEQRAQQVARMARGYRKKNNGKFDEGFFDELRDWSNKNQLFPEAGDQLPPLSDKAKKYLEAAGN